MARRLHDHWLIGLLTTVLTHDVEDVTRFSRELVLPTRLQVLKLHLFFKDEAGRGNRHVKITGKVEKVVKHYLLLEMDQDCKAS